jgi:LTXXQ motif family protein
MTPFQKSATTAVAAAAFAATVLVPPIAAQPAPQGRMGPGGHMLPQMGGGMMRMMSREMMGMADHVEGRIAFLKTELKITDAQMPQWTAFADTLRANAKRMNEMRNSMTQGGMMHSGSAGDAPISATERLDRVEKMMTAMTEAIKATKSALTPLYAVLSDAQKKVADQLIQGPMGLGHLAHGPMGMGGR